MSVAGKIAVSTPIARDPSLFPFALSEDPALALNEQAKAEGWPIQFDTLLEFEPGPLLTMREIWRARCRPGRLPTRAEFTLQILKPIVRHVSILEIENHSGRRRYFYRLVGSAVAARVGEFTGKYADEVLPAPLYRKNAAYFDAVVEHRCPIRVITDFELESVNHTRGDGLVMPLSSDGVTPNMVLTVSEFAERPPFSPLY